MLRDCRVPHGRQVVCGAGWELRSRAYIDFLSCQYSERLRRRPAELSPFSTLASASLRADSGCSMQRCRTQKLGILARYAAMYADEVFLPVWLTNPDSTVSLSAQRDEICRTAFSVLELRPLVERGLVRPVLPVAHYCSECARASP